MLVDLDAQASLTFSFITPDAWQKNFEKDHTIKSWFDSFDSGAPVTLQSLVHNPSRVSAKLTGRGTLGVIFSHLGLINVDLELATKLGGASLSQAKKNFLSVHTRLAEGLKSLKAENNFDVVLIDCPPNFNVVTKTAIIASDYILVPTRPDELSTLGIDYLMRSINGLIKDYNDFTEIEGGEDVAKIKPKVVGVVFTMIQQYADQPIAAQRTYISRVKTQSRLKVFDSYIKRNDTLFASAPQYGVPVVLTYHNNYSHQSVVDGLEAVTTEFVNILKI